jgi:putative membrane protein
MAIRTVSDYFTPADLDRIREAVRVVELKTSAEIVPFIIEKSDDYEEALWRGMLAGSLALTFFVFLNVMTAPWLPFNMIVVVLMVLVAGGTAMLTVRNVPSLRRLVAGKELIELRVAQRAKEAFLAEEIFATRDRTGILLFISLLEHRVVVLGDSGINKVLHESDWASVVEAVTAGLRSGRPVNGVVEALQQMARLLEERGFARRSDDVNELPDPPRRKENK